LFIIENIALSDDGVNPFVFKGGSPTDFGHHAGDLQMEFLSGL
jgi:hypothetical protein